MKGIVFTFVLSSVLLCLSVPADAQGVEKAEKNLKCQEAYGQAFPTSPGY